MQSWKKAIAGLQGKIERARTDLESFVEVARVALDPLRTPDEIHRTAVATGDAITGRVTIRRYSLTEEKTKGLPSASQVTLSRTVPVYGRWSLDVSAGFLTTGLRQRNFITAPSPDSSSTGRVVRKGSEDEIDIAPGIFVHYVWLTKVRLPKAASAYLGIGPALGLTTSSPNRYFTGGSLQVGRSVRLTISYGRSWGKVRVLNGERENGQLLNMPLSVVDVTQKDWGLGVSFAINPPFPGKRSQN
jgi:hypothetical protein